MALTCRGSKPRIDINPGIEGQPLSHVEDDIGSRANDASTSRYERKQVAMDPQSAEISPVTFVRRESAAISVAMESSVAADAATLTSDNGSERRAFSIGEVQKMTCPRCLHTFPVEFYCIKCGYVPTGQENRRSRNVCNERQTD